MVRWPALPQAPLLSASEITDLSSFTLRGDIRSFNWDGGSDLSSGADTGATAGFLLDSSAGAAQFQTVYAEGGEIANLTITGTLTFGTGAVLRTAASGKRLELAQASGTDRFLFYDGVAANSGSLIVLTKALRITAPYQVTGEEANIYLDGLNAEILFNTGGAGRAKVTTQGMGLSLNGSPGSPSLFFVNDTNTGIYRNAADVLGFAAGGAERAVLDANRWGIMNGTEGIPSHSFLSDANTGMYLVQDGVIGFSANGTVRFKVTTTGVQVPNHGTTGSAANAVIDTGASDVILRSTSARKYKSRITYDTDYLADIELRPAKFYRKDDHHWFYGLIADDLAEQDESLVVREKDEIENYDDRQILAVMAAKLNRLERKAAILEAA